LINGTDTEPLRSPQTRAQAILPTQDGTFEVSFETIEEVVRFSLAIVILQGDSIINSFVGSGADGLQCLPGECGAFASEKDYELTILVPCDPDDCVQFPPPN
jgi:hypothetical protein